MIVFRRLGCWLGSAVVGVWPITVAPAQQPPAGNPAKATATASPPPGTILQPGENPIDLGTALRLAGADNPELLLARERVTEAAALRQLAAAQWLPNLNLGTNYNLHRGALQPSNGQILTVNRDAVYVGLGASAVGTGTVAVPGLNYNLHLGEAYFLALQTRQLVVGRQFAAQAAENDVLLRVCLGYTDLLRAEGRRAIAARNREEAAEVVRLTEAYARAGQGRKADADRATVELRRRDADLTQSEADALTATARLARLLNLDPSTRLRPIDGWVVPAPVVPDPIPLAELVAIAAMQRPELGERRADIQRSIYALSSAKLLPFTPTVVLGFSAGGFGGGSDLSRDQGTGPRFATLDGRADFDVIVFWTLRNLGVGNVAITREAESVVRQTRLRELEMLNRVRAEVAEAHARTRARFVQLDSAEAAVKAGTEAFTQDLARIRGQQGLPIELVDSLRLLGQARYDYLDTVLDYNRAQFQLYVALGQPPAAALARPVPAELVPPPAAVGVPVPGQGFPPGTAPAGPRLLVPPKPPLPAAGGRQ